MNILVHLAHECSLPSSDRGEIPVEYWIKNVPPDITYPDFIARAALIQYADPIYDNRRAVSYEVTREGPTTFRGRVVYEASEWDYQFEIATEETLVTRSLETTGQHCRSGVTPANFRQLIGVTRDGVDGTRVQIPVFAWNESHSWEYSFVDETYRNTLYQLVGKMCSGPFRNKQRGEVFFAGVTGGIARGRSRWSLNYRFLASPNVQSLTIDGITVASKLGWEYLWTYQLEWPDLASGRIVKRIEQINVERVIEFGDFNRMSLPAT